MKHYGSYLRNVIIASLVMIGAISAAYAAPTTLVVSGYVAYEDGSDCSNSTINVVNLNTTGTWEAETSASWNYYRVTMNSTDVSANDTLQFDAASPDGSQSSITERVVTQDEIDVGTFEYDITLAAAAAEEDTIIAIEDIVVEPAGNTTVPIMVLDVVDMGGCELTFTYNQTVVQVTEVTKGDMNFSFEYNINNGSGWIKANALDAEGVSGDVVFAHLNLTAIGDAGDISPMDIASASLIDINYTEIIYTVNNGSFAIIPAEDTTPPEIVSVVLDPEVVMPTDPIAVTVTATDASGIASIAANGVSLADAGNDEWTGMIPAASTPGVYNVTVVAIDNSTNANNATDDSATYEVKLPALIAIEDVVVEPAGSTIIPIMVLDVVDMGGCELTFTYNQTVVHVTEVTRGDMNFSFEYNINNGSGWMKANALDAEGVSGDVVFAHLTLAAMGNKGDMSNMTLEDSRLLDISYKEIAHVTRDGTFTIGANIPPKVTNVSATPGTILYDNGRPRASGTNLTSLSAHVTDADGNITEVIIDLSSIGGLSDQPMTYVAGDLWEVTTNATEVTLNVPNFTHQLAITATDDTGATNDPVSIELIVLKRGDVNGDGLVNEMDADYISSYLIDQEPEASNPPAILVGDVVGDAGCPMGDGVVDLMDALYIARYTIGMEEEA